ncbi:hypothetical protein Sps_01447 [Shewanella psychrophila]|uniref:Uncharacterized protein n=1 Tax=Shewanella psychrophila TaxID=225848 RepID=A0A1S6HM73_9GAMM|nr:hypothetical protein [Shewanella psychrophila]AQS36613.1 hypothetical protein Sps_01447 [Shewanella psychrophila]
MVNTSELASIDDDTSFQLDNRTVKDKLQYIYDYAAKIPNFPKTTYAAEIETTEVSSEFYAW